jgi:predicted dehydrogenase
MGRNLDEARQLTRAAEGRRLKIGFNHRYHPGIRGALRLLTEGAIGSVINARARYGHGGRPGYEKEWRGDLQRAGGGELTDQGVHVLDLLQCINGPPREVFCMTQTAVWPVAPLEDNGFGLLRYASGATASFHTSWTQWKNLFSLEVFGTEGYLTVEGLGGSYGTETLTLGRRHHDGQAPHIRQEAFPGADESWTREWAEFVDAIIEGGPYQGTPAEGVQVMQALEALYQSARTGSVVAV